MTASGGWRTLDLPLTGVPKLLLKASVTSTGYEVQLTDLCRVWAEKLSKKDIIRRAWDDNCSIDPSEDDKQFTIFLEKIESALTSGSSTTIDLLPGTGDELYLKLTAELPKPFKTLVWNISLSRQPDAILAETLIVPLLQQANGLQSQVQQLIHELQEKDRVISKITDRLETSGNDLTTVFPGVSNVRTNKKKTQREQLAKHVKGLADFDETEWRRNSRSIDGSTVWESLDRVLGGLQHDEIAGPEPMIRDKWWQTLTEVRQVEIQAKSPASETEPVFTSADNGTPSRNDDSVLDDAFQRQATPDHLKRKPSEPSSTIRADGDAAPSTSADDETAEHHDDGDSTTEDEDDLDAPSRSKPLVSVSKSPPIKSPSVPPSRKLGAIGGRSSKPSSSPEQEPVPQAQPQPARPRAKLGAIGGQATAAAEPPRKMGIIGGKRKPSESVPHAAPSPELTTSSEPSKERSRAPTKESTPAPRETSQERADRKRDELKRELEQKAKAPAKKKRKF